MRLRKGSVSVAKDGTYRGGRRIRAGSKPDSAADKKETSTEKIDGAIAMIMGLDRAIRCGNDSGESVYDDRGILFCNHMIAFAFVLC